MNGKLVGVCIGHAEVVKGKRMGIFSSVENVRDLLRRNNLVTVVDRSEARAGTSFPALEPPDDASLSCDCHPHRGERFDVPAALSRRLRRGVQVDLASRLAVNGRRPRAFSSLAAGHSNPHEDRQENEGQRAEERDPLHASIKVRVKKQKRRHEKPRGNDEPRSGRAGRGPGREAGGSTRGAGSLSRPSIFREGSWPGRGSGGPGLRANSTTRTRSGGRPGRLHCGQRTQPCQASSTDRMRAWQWGHE